MENAARVANVTPYTLPRHLTITRPDAIPHPIAIEIDERTGHVDAICVGDNRRTVLGYSNLHLLARWHGIDPNELVAVLSGWSPTHRLTHAGTVSLVMLAADGTGDAFTGKEWAEGDLPRWMRDEAGRWFERDGDGVLAAREGVQVEVLEP